MYPENTAIKAIRVADDRLKPDEQVIKQLMESIKKVGLLQPIVVCRKDQMGVHLVAGRNRLEACKRLKMEAIRTYVENGDTPKVRQWRELAEIDENLIRRNLGTAQRDKLTAHRKEVYEIAHPEAPKGKGGARSGSGRPAKVKSTRNSRVEKTPGFVADTARKSGRDKSTEIDTVRETELIARGSLQNRLFSQ